MSGAASFETGRGLSRRAVLKAGGVLAGASILSTWIPEGRAGAVASLRTISEWEQAVLAFWNDPESFGDEHYLQRSLSGDSYRHYWLGYGIDATTALAQATGKTAWLSRALAYGRNLVETAVPSSSLPNSQHKDGYLAWPSGRAAYLGKEIPLDESICWRSVTRLLRVVRDTPAWYGDPAIRAAYDELLDFAEVNIFEKWYTRSVTQSPPLGNIYRSVTHIASHWAFIGLNLSYLTDSASRRSIYDQVRENIDTGPMPVWGSSLHDQMIANPSNPEAYFWNWTWGSYSTPGSDIFHGSHVVDYILEAHDNGVSWSSDDIQKFVVLFDQVVWPANDQMASYVDGSGLHQPTSIGGTGGFYKLGRHDAALQSRLDDILDVADGMTMSDLTAPAYANRALNAQRLGVRYGYSVDQTVAFDDEDSHVPNSARSDGWTIQDLVQAASPFAGPAEFVRLVGDVAAEFGAKGLISERQRGALIAAAARSASGRRANGRSPYEARTAG